MTLTLKPEARMPHRHEEATPKAKTRPPVELVCPDMPAALKARRQLAHNALAWALLHSQHVPLIRAFSGIPNGQQRGDTTGGPELQAIGMLNVRIEEAYVRQAMTEPDSEARELADRALDRMEAHRDNLQGQLDALNTTPSIPAGHRDQYRVIVPALHARVAGVEHVAGLWRGTVVIDDRTPRLDEYLGRAQWPGHQARGDWPLYKVRSDGSRLLLASSAEHWHADLIETLWPAPSLLSLAVSMSIGIQARE